MQPEETPRRVCFKKLPGNGMLWDIGVLQEHRRKGIATKLLNEGIRRGKRQGMRRLEAWSIEPNAWKFYEKYGFRKFYEYHHVLIDDRERLRAFAKDGMHTIELYAYVMPKTGLKTIIAKYQPKDVMPCHGFELTLE